MLGGLLSAPSVARTKTADVTHHPAKSGTRSGLPFAGKMGLRGGEATAPLVPASLVAK